MAVLKTTMVMGLVLFGLIPLIDACWKLHSGGIAGQCKDPYDNSMHKVGQTWTNRYCLELTCSSGYMTCCPQFPKSVTRGCTLEKNWQTCKYTVTKSDPSIDCKVKF